MHKGMPLHLHFTPRASQLHFGVAAQDHTARRAGGRARVHCYVDSGSRSTLAVDAADLVLAADAEQDFEPAQGYSMRREARWNPTLAANPLASRLAQRVGTFPHSLPVEEGSALTSLMIARALGTTVEQVGLASGNCHDWAAAMEAGWVLRLSFLPDACLSVPNSPSANFTRAAVEILECCTTACLQADRQIFLQHTLNTGLPCTRCRDPDHHVCDVQVETLPALV